MTRFAISSMSVAALLAAPAAAQCFDWSDGFVSNGTSDEVWCQATFDDGSGEQLYVGGTFTTAGSNATGLIARWDGAAWTDVGGGIRGDSFARVQVLRVLDLGAGTKLYAAGEFDFAGGQPANNVAVWDGAAWSPLGDGMMSIQLGYPNGTVYSLEVFDDGAGPQLYAGGYFYESGTTPVGSLARWDGAQWSQLPGGIISGSVRALAVFDSGDGPALYAGGFFHLPGQSNAPLAQWDGAAWQAIPGATNSVYALQAFDDGAGARLYAAGTFGSGSFSSKLARWDGAQLETFPVYSMFYSSLSVLDDGVHGEQIYACGSAPTNSPSGVLRWDGAAWSPVGASTSPNGVVWSVAAYDDGAGPRVFAGGGFNAVGGQTANFVARFDGAAWLPLGIAHAPDEPVLGLATFDFGGGDELVATGSFRRAGSAAAGSIARWNGAAWSDIGGSGNPGLPYYAAIGWVDGQGSELFVGGQIYELGGALLDQCVVSWDGVDWATLGTGILNQGESRYARAFAVYDDGGGDALYVGGHFAVADGAPGKRIAKWDGATWSNLGGGIATNHEVRALTVYDDGGGAQLYVGGNFTISDGLPGRLRRWNGASWSALAGGGPDGIAVNALCVFDDGRGPALYAAGEFENCGGVVAHNIARWDGATWEALDTGTTTNVNALAVFDDGRGPALYAAGDFTFAGSTFVNRVARWDGASWEALGVGVNDEVLALHVFDDGSGSALFAGGAFTTAGGRVSNYLAKWGRVRCSSASYCTAGITSNGCVPAISGIGSPRVSRASGFTIRIDNVEGQKQGHIFYGVNGALANPWSPLSSSYLCVKAPTQRTPTQNSLGTNGACDGAMQIDWLDYVATHPSSLGAPFSPGTQVWAQLYFRDPPAPKTTNLSDALTFFVCP